MEKPNHNFELLRKVRGDLDELLTEFVTTQKVISKHNGAWARLATYTSEVYNRDVCRQVTENESEYLGTQTEVIYALNFDGPVRLEAKLTLILSDDGSVSVHVPDLNDIRYVHEEHGSPFKASDMRQATKPLLDLLHTYVAGNKCKVYWDKIKPIASSITNESYKGLKVIRPEVALPSEQA